jgi:hypothetical protein
MVRIFLLLVMLMRATIGKSKPMRAGLHTGTCRLRWMMKGILF